MTQNFLLVHPDEAPFTNEKKAHLAYRISENHLLRGNISSDTRGGWMVISSNEKISSHSLLFSEIISECNVFGYEAVLFPSGIPIDDALLAFWNELSICLLARKIRLILPLSASAICPNASFHVSSAVSGGSLRAYLETLIHKVGAQNLIIEHPLIRRTFDMPSKSGEGVPITEQELQTLLSRSEIQSFYSPDLCTNYFTYHTSEGAHFVLFDDARSLSAKAKLCETLGLKVHLYLFSEIKNLTSQLCF